MKKVFRKAMVVAMLATTISGNAQVPTIQWQKCFGGFNRDNAASIWQTLDGGYIIAGFSESNDGDVSGHQAGIGGFTPKDYWVVKTDPDGNILYQKCLGGSKDEEAKSVQQTTDGGFIVAGYSASKNGHVTGNHDDVGYKGDFWIVKLGDTLNIEWEKALGGNMNEVAYFIQQTNDGGYIIAGSTISNNSGDVGSLHTINNSLYGAEDFWIVKLGSSGIIQWQKVLGGTGKDVPYSIQQTSDGGYIISGETNSYGDTSGVNGDVSGYHGTGYTDIWTVKLDHNGTIDWQKCLGGSNYDYAYSIQQTADGGYIMAGSSESSDGDVSGNKGSADYWIVKLSSSGALEWQKCLGGTEFEYATSIQQTTDGGYIVAGASTSNDGDVNGHHGTVGNSFYDYWIVKLSSSGSIEWQKSMGGTGAYDVAASIKQTTDGGYIVTGTTSSNDGDVSGYHLYYDYWVVKLSAGTTGIEETTNSVSFIIYPNPANDFVTITNLPKGATVNILDVTGKVVYSSSTTNEQTSTINTADFTNGIYLISVENKGTITNRKLIVNR